MSRETMFLIGVGAVILAWKLTGKKKPAGDVLIYGPPLPSGKAIEGGLLNYGPPSSANMGPDYGPPASANMGPDYGPPNVQGGAIYQTDSTPAGWVDPFAAKVV